MLLVCTGNICRSPIAEQVLRSRSAELLTADCDKGAGLSRLVSFNSAGTSARAGDLMPTKAVALSIQMGGAPEGHTATPLSTDAVEKADLVLGMAREHRSEIVRLSPLASASTFTLIEFARLLNNLRWNPSAMGALPTVVDRSFFTTLTALVASRRGQVFVPDGASDDVIDPYRRSQETYDLAGDSIRQSVDSIFESLRFILSRAR